VRVRGIRTWALVGDMGSKRSANGKGSRIIGGVTVTAGLFPKGGDKLRGRPSGT